MGRRITGWAVGGLLALCLLAAPERAAAYLIFTSPPEDVVPHASHVLRVALPETPDGYTVEHVYRGTVEPGPLRVQVLPSSVGWVLRHGEIPDAWDRKPKIKAVSMILALYAMDGRYHVVGRHPAHGIPPHSSVWMISAAGGAYGFRQIMNPGGPVPVMLPQKTRAEFDLHLDDLLLRHRFEGARHRPLPEVERATFLRLIEPTIDWYRRRVAVFETPSADRLALAVKVEAYGRLAPESMRLHVFDVLLLLTAVNGHAAEHEGKVGELMLAHIKRGGLDDYGDAILAALEHQRYMNGSRTILLWILKETDAALYRKGVAVLRALCLRQMYNEAVAAYYALKQNGEEDIVREIDAAWAKMEAREQGSGKAPAAEAKEPPAAAPDAGGDHADEVPRARLVPRIEVGDRPGPEAGVASRRDDPGGEKQIPITSLLVIAALVGLGIIFVVRRS